MPENESFAATLNAWLASHGYSYRTGGLALDVKPRTVEAWAQGTSAPAYPKAMIALMNQHDRDRAGEADM